MPETGHHEQLAADPVGIFPEVTLNWRHLRSATTASRAHWTHDPDYASEVSWYLHDEAAGPKRGRLVGRQLSRLMVGRVG